MHSLQPEGFPCRKLKHLLRTPHCGFPLCCFIYAQQLFILSSHKLSAQALQLWLPCRLILVLFSINAGPSPANAQAVGGKYTDFLFVHSPLNFTYSLICLLNAFPYHFLFLVHKPENCLKSVKF